MRFARLFGYPTDGFSKPYHIGFILNALLFIFLGLLYLRKLLRLFFTDSLTALLILIGFAASNIYITYTQQPDLPHLYLFCLNAAFLYYLFRFLNEKRRRLLILSALFFGLTLSIRPTQALLGIIPFILLYKEYRFSKAFWKNLLWFPFLSIAWNIPQMLYWQIVGGQLLILNLHLEEIIPVDPNLLDFLFSYRKGWLLYSPVFLLLIPGFITLFRQQRNRFWAILTGSVIYIYIMSSWECWWYASSFGSRVMVDIYPLLFIVLGYALIALKPLWSRIIAGIFISLCILLNGIQSRQFEMAYLDSARMSKQHYWYIFGKLNIPDYSNIHLLIDREDLDWTEQSYPKDQYTIEAKTIFKLDQAMVSIPGEDLTIGRLNVFELLKTDETQLDVRIVVKTSDSTQSSLLRLETVSPYNCYSWDHIEVSQGFSQTEFTELYLRFNLPDIRHAKDQIQMYLDNDAPVSVEIKEMEITAFSLIRK